tara:strand:+ start:588 stop:1172 length:585 start_codon:yes stop_codon:yes gene_type:complete
MEEYAIRVGKLLYERLLNGGWLNGNQDPVYYSEDAFVNELCDCLQDELNPVAHHPLRPPYAPRQLEVGLQTNNKLLITKMISTMDDVQVWDFCDRLNRYGPEGRQTRTTFMMAFQMHPDNQAKAERHYYCYLDNDEVHMVRVDRNLDGKFNYETEREAPQSQLRDARKCLYGGSKRYESREECNLAYKKVALSV